MLLCTAGSKRLLRRMLTPKSYQSVRRVSIGLEPEAPLAGLPEHVRLAAEQISAALSSKNITHAIAGGIACHAHGHRRATEDVDVLVNAEDARGVVFSLLDSLPGYAPRFRGSRRSWRDTQQPERPPDRRRSRDSCNNTCELTKPLAEGLPPLA